MNISLPGILTLYCFLISMLSSSYAQQDSIHTLTLAEYISIIKQYHPVAKQADILTEQAKVNLRIARGGFDPILYSEYERKEFLGKNYYSFFSSSLKVPAWYGIEIKTGYDAAYGLNINPENSVPENGIYYIGISVPILKNMIIDKKRSDLSKAKIFINATEQERILMLNELLLDALQAYYDWSEAEQLKIVYDSAQYVALTRYRAIVRSYELGDRAAIDTMEALTQYQQRIFQFNEAVLNVQKARLSVAGFLWTASGNAALLPDTIQPQLIDSSFIEAILKMPLEPLEILLAQVNKSHPEIRQYDLKLQQLGIERKLKKEQLKPSLYLNYNLLSPGFFNYTSPANAVFTNYYKLGMNFSMPLSFTRERAELKQVRLKITDTQLQMTQKQRTLELKLMSLYAELTTLKAQIALYKETLINYQRIFSGEAKRFSIGESNLFLVNTRENSAITAQQKLIELQVKYVNTEAKLKWLLAGLLN